MGGRSVILVTALTATLCVLMSGVKGDCYRPNFTDPYAILLDPDQAIYGTYFPIDLTCETGHTSSGLPDRTYCGVNGTWGPDPAGGLCYRQCNSDEFDDDISVNNVILSVGNNQTFDHRDTVSLACKPPGQFIGDSSATCDNGTFDATASCEAYCAEPAVDGALYYDEGVFVPINTTDGIYFEDGATLTFSCADGFALEDCSETCLTTTCDDGSWSPDELPTCKGLTTKATTQLGITTGGTPFTTVSLQTTTAEKSTSQLASTAKATRLTTSSLQTTTVEKSTTQLVSTVKATRFTTSLLQTTALEQELSTGPDYPTTTIEIESSTTSFTPSIQSSTAPESGGPDPLVVGVMSFLLSVILIAFVVIAVLIVLLKRKSAPPDSPHSPALHCDYENRVFDEGSSQPSETSGFVQNGSTGNHVNQTLTNPSTAPYEEIEVGIDVLQNKEPTSNGNPTPTRKDEHKEEVKHIYESNITRGPQN